MTQWGGITWAGASPGGVREHSGSWDLYQRHEPPECPAWRTMGIDAWGGPKMLQKTDVPLSKDMCDLPHPKTPEKTAALTVPRLYVSEIHLLMKGRWMEGQGIVEMVPEDRSSGQCHCCTLFVAYQPRWEGLDAAPSCCCLGWAPAEHGLPGWS